MPTFSVNAIVAKAQKVYPTLPTSEAIGFLNDVRRDLFSRLGLASTGNTINVVADTPDYPISATATRIQAIDYRTSATERVQLEIKTIQEMNADHENWEYQDSGLPRFAVVTYSNDAECQITLVPAPDTTTTGGYPLLAVSIEYCPVLIAGDDFNDDLPNDAVYVDGISAEWARAKHVKDYPLRAQILERSMQNAYRYNRGKVQSVPPALSPGWLNYRS